VKEPSSRLSILAAVSVGGVKDPLQKPSPNGRDKMSSGVGWGQ